MTRRRIPPKVDYAKLRALDWRKMAPKICIGFGEFEGKCKETAGTPWTKLWCLRCDELRRAHITKRLEGICK